MKFEQLADFIQNKMKMDTDHNYQPVMLKTLINNGGKATHNMIKKALEEENPELEIKPSSVDTVIKVLTKNNPVATKHDDGLITLNDFDSFTITQREKIIQLCNDKIIEASAYSSKKSRRLVLFSVSGSASYEHFVDTMKKDVDTSKLTESKIKQYSKVRAWGAIPSKQAVTKWLKLQPGDILLFYRDKKYIASAILEGTEQNSTVAKQMWNTKPDSDQTWELIMYMKPENVRDSDVDYQSLNKLLDYKENFMPTRTLDFTLVREEATKNLEKQHGSLENALYKIGFNFDSNEISKNILEELIEKFDKNRQYFKPNRESTEERNRIRDKFVTEFSLENIKTMDITDYVQGKRDPQTGEPDRTTFSYMVERGIPGFGGIGGTPASKFGIYFGRQNQYEYKEQFDSPESAFDAVRDDIIKIIEAGQQFTRDHDWNKLSEIIDEKNKHVISSHVRSKILAVYFPNHFLDIHSRQKVIHLLDYFGIDHKEIEDKLTLMQAKLLDIKNDHPIMNKWPIQDYSHFLWNAIVKSSDNDTTENIPVYGTETPKPSLKTFEDDPLPVPSQEDLKNGYEKVSDELLIPESKVIEIVTALASGRHVLLAGPIGTGKTRLAQVIPRVFWSSIGGYYSEDYTATADWSTQDVIGGIFPKMSDGKPLYEIQNGCVVETVSKNWENGLNGGKRRYFDSHRGTWLIIDEFNRADIDKAFGQLFTSLRTKTLKIPTDAKGISYKTLKIPEDYRIIGTLNTADKHFLFQLSDALKSRFAYIEIDIPRREEFEKEIYYSMKNAIEELGEDNYESLIVLDHDNKIIDKENTDEDFYKRIYHAYYFLDLVRIFKKLGPAVLKLIYQNLLVGTQITKDSKLALDNSLKSTLIPQLENLSRSALGSIQALYSKDIVEYFKNAYKNPNRQSYSEDFIKVLDYLEIPNSQKISTEFSNGTLQVDNDSTWKSIKDAQQSKQNAFEQELNQLKQSMDDLISSVII